MEFHNYLMNYLHVFYEFYFERMKFSDDIIEKIKKNINNIIMKVNTKR